VLKELDEDRIIVGDDIIQVISISNKTIIKEINNEFRCIGICVIKEKGIFLIGGYDNKIKIYRSDILELIETINNGVYIVLADVGHFLFKHCLKTRRAGIDTCPDNGSFVIRCVVHQTYLQDKNRACCSLCIVVIRI
jgi:hypothetical protein